MSARNAEVPWSMKGAASSAETADFQNAADRQAVTGENKRRCQAQVSYEKQGKRKSPELR